MKNKYLLIFGIALVVFGLFGSNLNIPVLSPSNTVCSSLEVEAPSSENLKELADKVVECLQNGDSDRKVDGPRLASLYNDMSVLIALDENSVINNTNAIREANVLAARLLQINLKDKYDGLAQAMTNLVETHVTEKSVPLDSDLRDKAVEAFSALAWACLEGSK